VQKMCTPMMTHNTHVLDQLTCQNYGTPALSLVRHEFPQAPWSHTCHPLQGAETLGLSVPAYLEQLRDAGLGSLPGTAAEVLDDDVRGVLCPDKINTQRWLEVGGGVMGWHRHAGSASCYGRVAASVATQHCSVYKGRPGTHVVGGWQHLRCYLKGSHVEDCFYT
jgi:hypothetical protein